MFDVLEEVVAKSAIGAPGVGKGFGPSGLVKIFEQDEGFPAY